MSALPVIDEDYANRIFAVLSNMEVTLDYDPISHGPKRMNAKIAECRNHLDRCQQIYLQVSNDLHALNRAQRQAKVAFDLQMQDMLSYDPETRAGRSVRDREAVATMKLRVEREAISNMDLSISDLDSVMIVVKAKRDDLKDTLGRIRDQLKLCQEELGLGGRWGSAPVSGQRVPDRNEGSGVDPLVLASMDSIPGEDEPAMSDLERFVAQSLKADGAKATPAAPRVPPVAAVEPAPTPAPVVVAAPPVVEPVAPPVAPPVVEPVAPASSVDSEFDDILSKFEDEVSGRPGATSPVVTEVSEIDLDDLLGSF